MEARREGGSSVSLKGQRLLQIGNCELGTELAMIDST